MKRPSFQFYPGDWQANSNLRRCTHAEKGVWLDVMCLMHDQPEYGVLRWPLKEIAQAVGARVADLRALSSKGVLKGSDTQLEEAFTYTPRSGRRDGEPVTLVPTQAGPIWYSSRMVKDEYVRTIRGESTRFGDDSGEAPKRTPKRAPKHSPKPTFGDGSSSSSSSSTSVDTPQPPKGGCRRFEEFWTAWPKSERKQDKVKCAEKWRRADLDSLADTVLADIELKRQTEKWRSGFIEAPLVYLNGRRWEDGVTPGGAVDEPNDWTAGVH
jgi:hypothetical protein